MLQDLVSTCRTLAFPSTPGTTLQARSQVLPCVGSSLLDFLASLSPHATGHFSQFSHMDAEESHQVVLFVQVVYQIDMLFTENVVESLKLYFNLRDLEAH